MLQALHQLKVRRPEVDLLRVGAIIGVLFIHNLYDWEPSTMAVATKLWGLAGWSVLIFFFLSGLLSRPAQGPAPVVRLGRSIALFVAWLLWGTFYTLAGLFAQKLWLVDSIPNLFRLEYPFFDFAYQLYFLVVLALIQALQDLWVWFSVQVRLSQKAQSVFELLLAIVLLICMFYTGWPKVPHGSFPNLYPLYGLAYLSGVLQARSILLGLCFAAFCVLSAFTVLAADGIPGPLWFLILASTMTPLLARLLRKIPPQVLAPLALLSSCSGAIYLLHHPFLLPLSRRFWRLGGVPDSLNYALCIALACLLPILLVLIIRPLLHRWPWLGRMLLVQPNAFRSAS